MKPLFVLAMLLSACGPSETVKGRGNLLRFENTEVVCFQPDIGQGFWCYRKDEEKK